ncbi:MAG: hypothetical protein KAU50_10720 [Candidatus Marinimicrobia bacterium]|nr:hypothetical protein [Candidatus Neomarinimicrobiota bacterium]
MTIPVPRPAICFALAILMIGLANGHAGNDRMRVGIVEFREENDIGLENAGRIVGEWVASEVVRVGRFDVSERLSLEAVLLEQDLGLTGVLDDATEPV